VACQRFEGIGEYIRKGNLETLLNLFKDLLIVLVADEGDRKTLSTKTASTTNTVQVRVSVRGEIVVDGKVDTLDINTTTEDISGDTDTLVELLEFLVTLDSRRGSVMAYADVECGEKLTAPPG
jgi:hypothetical protein